MLKPGAKVIVANGLAYLGYGLVRGHFARRFLPLTPRLVWAERASYVGVLVLGILLVVSGLSLWKPVQLQALASLIGRLRRG